MAWWDQANVTLHPERFEGLAVRKLWLIFRHVSGVSFCRRTMTILLSYSTLLIPLPAKVKASDGSGCLSLGLCRALKSALPTWEITVVDADAHPQRLTKLLSEVFCY